MINKGVEKVLDHQVGRCGKRHQESESDKTDQYHAIGHFQPCQEKGQENDDAVYADRDITHVFHPAGS
jgi:hypothetical protein